ncbi:LysR family transcriptional regulator [Bradyrhizobium sp. LTSP849]|uniref:LysR family transcriptional regulator n=1 Tax=unclassified Bradyrhizobium TaxID=2631580 RepID=UPI0005D2A66F|nr:MULTISPECIES: LysR family transcriptional regulator [unclassified Bradyrhizobium]KJC50588.1 LysR family transcriptional regulator [Bradyrhizobium sp. LTSP849]KJC53062.1 LysR family transcriptional regulator [Bradyrhizobium sp. LTSP857]
MDRIDAMKIFVATLDEGGLRKAGRKLGRSPAAISRALASLEAHVGVTLLHRTTRSFKLSDAGERYALVCRRVIADLEEADLVAASERSTPSGTLTITAPVAAGEDILRPVLDEFMDAYPTVSVRLFLLDRPVKLIDEGMDIALRIGNLTDSTLVAIRLGAVWRVVAASPRYLSAHPKIEEVADLAKHKIIAMTHFGIDSWTFPPAKGSSIPRSVHFTPRFVVNSVRGAIAPAVEGRGITRLFSYHIAEQLSQNRLQVLLRQDDASAIPLHLISPQGRLAVPKVRAFVDFAVPRLKAQFSRLSTDAVVQKAGIRTCRERVFSDQ